MALYSLYFIILEKLDVTTLIEVWKFSKWLGIESRVVKSHLQVGFDNFSFDSELVKTLEHPISYTSSLKDFEKIFILADLTGNEDVVEKCAQICIQNDIDIKHFIQIIGLKELSTVRKVYFAVHFFKDCKILRKTHKNSQTCRCQELLKLRKTAHVLDKILLAHSSSTKFKSLKNYSDIEMAGEGDLESIGNAIDKHCSPSIVHVLAYYLIFKMKKIFPALNCVFESVVLLICLLYTSPSPRDS